MHDRLSNTYCVVPCWEYEKLLWMNTAGDRCNTSVYHAIPWCATTIRVWKHAYMFVWRMRKTHRWGILTDWKKFSFHLHILNYIFKILLALDIEKCDSHITIGCITWLLLFWKHKYVLAPYCWGIDYFVHIEYPSHCYNIISLSGCIANWYFIFLPLLLYCHIN